MDVPQNKLQKAYNKKLKTLPTPWKNKSLEHLMEITTEQALQRAIDAHKEGKLQDAERLYRAILRSQPLHPDANHNLGLILVIENKADVSLTLFKIALEANPKIEQFWLSYIDTLLKEKQFDNAKQVLEQGKKQGVDGKKLDRLAAQLMLATDTSSPSKAELNNLLEHFQNGRLEVAEKLAVTITKQFPNNQIAWKLLGAILGQLGRLDDALIASKNAVRINPHDAEAHNNVGITLKGLGRLKEAEGSLRQAIELKPNFVDVHYNLGITMQELGRLKQAEGSFREAIALQPSHIKAHNNLGTTLQEQNSLEEAEASFRRAIVVQPDFAEAHYNLGLTLYKLRRLEEATASYKQVIELQPDHTSAHSNLGNILQELGKLDEAEASYKKAIFIQNDFKNARAGLGSLLMKKGQHLEGLKNKRMGEGAIFFDIDNGIKIQ